MNHYRYMAMNSYRAQHGAVLIFSLIVLLLLTAIGVTAMQTTTLQERMAGGQRDRHLAVQGAEAAIRDAERFLEQASLPEFNGEWGFYHRDNHPAPAWQDAEWTPATSRAYREGETFDGLLAEAPRFYIEKLPGISDGSSLAVDEAIPDDDFFLIVARSTGASGQSEVILQVTYRR